MWKETLSPIFLYNFNDIKKAVVSFISFCYVLTSIVLVWRLIIMHYTHTQSHFTIERSVSSWFHMLANISPAIVNYIMSNIYTAFTNFLRLMLSCYKLRFSLFTHDTYTHHTRIQHIDIEQTKGKVEYYVST